MRVQPNIYYGIDNQIDQVIDILQQKTAELAKAILGQIRPENILIGSISALVYTCPFETDRIFTVFLLSTFGSALIDKIQK